MGVACCLSLSDGDDIMIRKLSLSITVMHFMSDRARKRDKLRVPIFAETAVFALHTLCNKIMSKLDSLKEAQTNRKSRA